MSRKELNKIVEGILKKHKGGEEFFNNLDPKLQKQSIMTRLWRLHNGPDSMIGYEPIRIILTGKFGYTFNNFLSAKLGAKKPPTFLVSGGLRTAKAMNDLDNYAEAIENRYFVLFDDSFYSGRTRDLIKHHIEELGGKFIKTYVVYDGSAKKEDEVDSLYRYYDHHTKPLPKK